MAEGGYHDGELRILLVGKTGHGKSSTGNTILDENYFKVDKSPSSVTTESDYKEGKRFLRNLVVVDTPGFYDTHRSQQEIKKELLRTLVFTTPGFHVIVFVLKPERFTEELKKTRNLFFDWFGEGVEKHSLMILIDTRDDNGVNDFFSKASNELLELRKRCGGVVVPIDNNADSKLKEKQVKHLFRCIDQIKLDQGSYFSNVWYQLAMRYINEKYPKELSNESVIMLEKAGVNKKDMKKICLLVDEDETNETTDDTSSVSKLNVPGSTGKLRILDTSSTGGGIYRKRTETHTQDGDGDSSSGIDSVDHGITEDKMETRHDFESDSSSSSETFPPDGIRITSENEIPDHGSVGGAKLTINKPKSQITSRRDRVIGDNFEVVNESRRVSSRKGRKVQHKYVAINTGNGDIEQDSSPNSGRDRGSGSKQRSRNYRASSRIGRKVQHSYGAINTGSGYPSEREPDRGPNREPNSEQLAQFREDMKQPGMFEKFCNFWTALWKKVKSFLCIETK